MVDVVVAVTVRRVLFVLHVCMLVVSAWHVGGIRGSCIVSSAADVLGMRGLGWRFTNPVEIGGVLCLCCGGVAMGGVGGEWVSGLGPGTGGVVLCLCEL